MGESEEGIRGRGEAPPSQPALRSEVRKSFWKLLEKLPARIQAQTRNAYEKSFRANPHHPALRGHWVPDTLIGESRVWAVSITREYRAMAIVQEDAGVRVYIWYWCGSHEDYNRRVGK